MPGCKVEYRQPGTRVHTQLSAEVTSEQKLKGGGGDGSVAEDLGRKGLGMLEDPKGQGDWSALGEDGARGGWELGRALPCKPSRRLPMGMTGMTVPVENGMSGGGEK